MHPVDEGQVPFAHSFFSGQGKLRKPGADIVRIGAEMPGNEQPGAERFQRLVDRHAGASVAYSTSEPPGSRT